MRISNIDTLSSLLDRLITENIKLFFFEKDGKTEKANHQREIISEIKGKINEIFIEAFVNGEYDYVGEKRTFANKFSEELEELIFNDIRIGEADRARLEELESDYPDFYRMAFNEMRLRMSNEGRSQNKNDIDEILKELAK